MKLVDSHCHLDDEKFDDDRERVIERALAAGVETMMAIGTGGELDVAIRQAERYPFIYATIGVHPHDASKATEDTYARLRDLAQHPKVLAIGEIGLDYHYDFSPRDVQRAVFVARWNRGVRKTDRDPHPRVGRTITRVTALPHGGIMHCFTGDAAQAGGAGARHHLSFEECSLFPRPNRCVRPRRSCPTIDSWSGRLPTLRRPTPRSGTTGLCLGRQAPGRRSRRRSTGRGISQAGIFRDSVLGSITNS